MKKLLLIVLIIIILISVPVFAAGDIHTWYVDVFIKDMNNDREAWNKETTLAYIKAMVKEGFITETDIQKAFNIKLVTTTQPTSTPKPTPTPTPNSNYASLEILPSYGFYLTKAGGHIYSIDMEYDDMEESITYVLEKDNKVVYRFNEYWGPRGIVQINGTIYVATVDAIYKYSNSKLTKITKGDIGPIQEMTSNGKDIYIACDDDNPGWSGRYFECTYFKISTSGTVTKLKGPTVATDYIYCDFSVNKDSDRLARVPINDSGTVIRNLLTGGEYFQRDDEESEPHAKYFLKSGEYSVESTLYYNNCLLVNVQGSLVYYDSKNKPHVILGNMKSSRIWKESYRDLPGELWPVKTGSGDKVALGYVSTWTIGDDGYIYGVTEEDYQTYTTFKLAIPDSIKNVVTYKKTK